MRDTMASKTGDDEVDAKVDEWMRWDKAVATKEYIFGLANAGQVEELRSILLHRMEFGTAGLRARMGPGYSMMNDLTIIQTSQGLCQYMLKNCPKVTSLGIVIGFDGRHNSHRFAHLVATVMVNAGIPVYLYSKMCPTPYVAYGVKLCKAQCGVMITASHNPKEDNGYKVYWENGAQIISPTDKGIATSILENLEPLSSSWETNILSSSPLVKDPYQDALVQYNSDLQKMIKFNPDARNLQVVYTAMHGVGYPYILQASKAVGHVEIIPVVEQVDADPDFPTVKYPNPEEGKGALELAMKTADMYNCPLILANDPDADRLAVAEKLPSGKWHIFSGNETGALLGWWSWFYFRQDNPDYPASEVYMISSTVSSKILQTMAKRDGFHHEETLTGFKWMGNRADNIQKMGKKVLFAFEESIGYMYGTNVLDKDGISAAMVCSQMASYLYGKEQTLYSQLNSIYQEYGYHINQGSYFICKNPDKIKAMFDEIRNYNSTGKYPESLGNYKIKDVRDLTVGYDSSTEDKKPVLPVSKSSQMITFTFENGCIATLRTSGTEPKIKYYIEHRPDPRQGIDRTQAEKELADMLDCIIKNLFQPDKFGFEPKSS